MDDDLLGPNGEHINGNTLQAALARDAQRKADMRRAAYFSTSSELGAYDIDDVRALYRGAI